jgi:mono/diheme cytochrome c family protein
MKKRVQFYGWLAAAISVCSLPAQAADGPQMAERHRALFQSYCVKCHNAEKQEGKFRVDNLAYTLSDLPTAERWQKVLNALNAGEMPPADEKQPQKQEKADFLDDLSNVMVAQEPQRSTRPDHDAAVESARVSQHAPRAVRSGSER